MIRNQAAMDDLLSATRRFVQEIAITNEDRVEREDTGHPRGRETIPFHALDVVYQPLEGRVRSFGRPGHQSNLHDGLLFPCSSTRAVGAAGGHDARPEGSGYSIAASPGVHAASGAASPHSGDENAIETQSR